MINKDKRSLLLATVLGDGCLYYSGGSQYTAYIAIKHGHKQKDYVEFKAKLLEIAMDRQVNVREASSFVKKTNMTYEQYVITVGWKRMRAWRKFVYLNHIKRHSRILPFITHPVFAMALWLMDDGTVGTGPACRSDKTNKERICSGMILYLGDMFRDDAYECLYWFERTFNVKPRLKWQNVKYNGTIRSYPELRFTVADSLYLWKHIRSFVLKIPSMSKKFEKLEQRFQRNDLIQPQADLIKDDKSEDIVHKILEKY